MSLPPSLPRLTILDVGHGNSAVIQSGAEVFVVDSGTGGHLLQFLEDSRISHINDLFISHSDSDHINGVTPLVNSTELSIGRLHCNGDGQQDSRTWSDFLYMLEERSRSMDTRMRIDFRSGLSTSEAKLTSGDVSIDVLAPNPALLHLGVGNKTRTGKKIVSNSLSAVIRVRHLDRPTLLLPGDIDEVGLEDLSRLGTDLKADILVYPHHGGRGRGSMTTFAMNLMTLVEPRIVVFSIGRGLHRTPQPEVVAAVRRARPGAWIACTQLSEHCAAEPPRNAAGHLSVVHARGKHTGTCCAGSLVIELGDSPRIMPEQGQHSTFVTQLGPSPLCRRILPPAN